MKLTLTQKQQSALDALLPLGDNVFSAKRSGVPIATLHRLANMGYLKRWQYGRFWRFSLTPRGKLFQASESAEEVSE